MPIGKKALILTTKDCECFFQKTYHNPQNTTTEWHNVANKGVIYLVKVEIRSNESQDQLLKRFRKNVTKSGILSTVRQKRWFISKSELRRIKRKKAIRRLRRRSNRTTSNRYYR